MNEKTDMIAIDLGGTSIRGVIINGNYRITHRIEQDTVKTSPGVLMRQITQLIGSLEKLEHKGIGSVGISVAGPINHKEGILIETPNLPFTSGEEKDFPLKHELEKALSMPIFVESEIKMAALAERSL